ncbi:hypothetical protein SCHPADRAFT_895103 [Schizopora paradoxa]|uniref:Uncharacterized protein n=1 Tax=Schizopora paradoxa TaxID=27342 RepID=A0A0H2RBF9_9AGAM|nr:hypothetical protein SCHPADRAFT_895103 [Schizopora paradoxa]
MTTSRQKNNMTSERCQSPSEILNLKPPDTHATLETDFHTSGYAKFEAVSTRSTVMFIMREIQCFFSMLVGGFATSGGLLIMYFGLSRQNIAGSMKSITTFSSFVREILLLMDASLFLQVFQGPSMLIYT